MSTVADAADGADGVMGSVLTHGRYPDGPRSQPPLAAEDNFNPKCAQEGLCPAQPAGQRPRGLWLARPVGVDLQKIRCASPPLRSVGHHLAHKGPDRKSTRLNSSHLVISYAVFCLKKKKKT